MKKVFHLKIIALVHINRLLLYVSAITYGRLQALHVIRRSDLVKMLRRPWEIVRYQVRLAQRVHPGLNLLAPMFYI